MTLQLLYHPLASFCHKVLIALYDNGTPFEGRIIDLSNPVDSAELRALSPIGKFPVLRDAGNGQVLSESSIIIEYLDHHYPGSRPLIPRDFAAALRSRLWDRFFDFYVQQPMQQIVGDRLRAEGQRDPHGVEAARTTLRTAYAVLDRQLSESEWAAGDDFGLADCAAAPALFYAGIVAPFHDQHRHIARYFDRLCSRAAVARTLKEAQPYFAHFPMREAIPARFLDPSAESFARPST